MKSDPHQKGTVAAKARAKRFQLLVDSLQARGMEQIRVLDLGGTVKHWRMALEAAPEGLIRSIDLVNVPPVQEQSETLAGVELRVHGGDACDPATFPAGEHDFVYSNSVIEHVGNLRNQKAMADAIHAYGKPYWVQTPAWSFPIEPHFFFPFFAQLPLGVRTFLHRRFKLGFRTPEPDWLDARMSCEETRLMKRREVAAMFPQATILRERMFGLTKSFIATDLTGAR